MQTENPQPVEVNGKPLRCVVCQHDRFWVTAAQLNKAVTTFFKLDWTDRSATCFVCSECTYIHWFLGQP
jgi:hypothetical protein